jgi:hypothetical protein
MRSFKDREGMEWQVDFTIGTAIKLKDRLGVDIDSTDNGLVKLASSGTLLFKALYLICEKQAQERKLDAEAFYERFTNDSIVSANAAFIEAITDFFPNARRRDVLKRLFNDFRALDERGLEQTEKAAAALEKSLESPAVQPKKRGRKPKQIESGNASGATPESAASQEPNSAA